MKSQGGRAVKKGGSCVLVGGRGSSGGGESRLDMWQMNNEHGQSEVRPVH